MNMMKYECTGKDSSFPALFAVLQWIFCDFYNVPMEKRGVAKDVIVQTAWMDEAQHGEELQMARRALIKANKELGQTTFEMEMAIEALSCAIQILNRQKNVSVEAVIADETAVVTVTCDTTTLSPRGSCIEVMDERTLKITLKKAA